MHKLSSAITNLNEVALGEKTADFVLKNCSLVNVYTNEIQQNMQVAVSGERIAFVGENASHTKGKKTTIIMYDTTCSPMVTHLSTK